MIFWFKNDQAREAVFSRKKVFSRKEYSKEAIEELKAWDKAHNGKAGFTFVD